MTVVTTRRIDPQPGRWIDDRSRLFRSGNAIEPVISAMRAVSVLRSPSKAALGPLPLGYFDAWGFRGCARTGRCDTCSVTLATKRVEATSSVRMTRAREVS
jgi:hypothetical protein